MAISGSFDFTVTRDNIIDLAHQYICAVEEGVSASTNATTEAARLLNMIVKLWHNDGMPVWALKRGTILPITDVSSIDTDSHVVTTYDSTYLSSAALSGASTFAVNAAGNIAASDQIGIELDSGNMQWTTVTSISGTTVTPAATLTGAAAANNRVYAYTASADRVQKPIRIVDVNVLNVSDNISWPIKNSDRAGYYQLGNRTVEGTANTIFYDPTPSTITALDTNGTIYFYPRFANGDKVIQFTYQRPFQDFDAATDNPDFPQAFALPLMIQLAALLGPKHGVTLEERAMLLKEALIYKQMALDTVYEEGSLFIQPDFR